MKKIIYLLTTLIILCGITSCNNFMNGSDLIQEIDEILADANAPEVEVLISSDGRYGTTAPNGKYLYKVNKKYPLMLQKSSDEYSFINWEVVNRETGEVLPDAVTFDDPSQLETNFKINYETTNLWIRPKCIQYPRIVDFSPKNKASGVICYTPIEIFFNMDISSEEVVETFDNIKIEIDEESVIDYFNPPVLSEDGQKIIIKPKSSIKNLVENVSFLDITVSVSDAIKAADNPDLHIEQYSNTYRINSAKDTTPPEITFVNFSRDSEQSVLIQKNEKIENWSSDDYASHHIFNSVWISCNATDKDSGIDSIIVTETIIFNGDGTPNNYTYPSKTVSKEFSLISLDQYSVEPFEYHLSTDVNSLVKLNIRVKDRAGYISESEEYNYYVVAEPVFQLDSYLLFDNPQTSLFDRNFIPRYSKNGIDELKISTLKNIYHTYYKNYKTNFKLKILSWDGKEEPEDKNKNVVYVKDKLDCDGNDFSFKDVKFSRKSTEITTVQMIISDDAGHVFEKKYKIPKSSKILSVISPKANKYKVYAENINDQYYDDELKVLILVKKGDDYSLVFNGLCADISNYAPLSCTSGEEYVFFSIFYTVNKDNNSYIWGAVEPAYISTYICENNEMRLKDNVSNISPSEVVFPTTVNVKKTPLKNQSTVHFSLSYPQNYIQDPRITFMVKLNVLHYQDQFEFFNSLEFDLPSASYIYYLILVACDSKGRIICEHPYGQKLFLSQHPYWENEIDDSYVLIDARDNLDPPEFLVEKSREGYGQLKPNAFTIRVMNTSRTNASDNLRYITFKSDGVLDGTKNGNSQDTVNLYYGYLENSLTDLYRMMNYNDSMSAILNKKEIVKLPRSDTSQSIAPIQMLSINCNFENNSYYTLYGKIKDLDENFTIKEMGVVSGYVYDSLPTVEKNDTNIKIKVDKTQINSTTENIKMRMLSILTETGDSWIDTVNTKYVASGDLGFNDSSLKLKETEMKEKAYIPFSYINSVENNKATTYNNGISTLKYKTEDNSTFDFITKLSSQDNFFTNRYVRFYIYTEPTYGENKEFMHKFYKSVYIYPDYYNNTITCNKKNFVEGANGLQFFIDQPTLVQTLYCKGNLGNDPDLWATKGIEADVRVLTSDCTYQPKTDEAHLPSGNYYCVVVHFADGTSCMSNVKYK